MIYLDYNATTPVDERVMSKILPFFSMQFGNAASAHPMGLAAKRAVDQARGYIAQCFGAAAQEIIFTSGATESCNLAIKGVYDSYQLKGKHMITVQTEHPAVLDSFAYLQTQGAEVTYLPVNAYGLVDLDELSAAIRPDTVLVAVMLASNETGVIQPIEEIGRICHQKDTMLFCDATQAVGKLAIHVDQYQVDLMAFSGHKIYAPKGVGGLYVRRKRPRVVLTEQINGGGHERGLRSGTLNVPGIVGIATALSLYAPEEAIRLGALRDQLESALRKLPGVTLNGHPNLRMDHVSNLSFDAVNGRQFLGALNKSIALSSGSACSAAKDEPSHVLRAMGISAHLASSAVRFSLGRFTTQADIQQTIDITTKSLMELRHKYDASTP